MTLSLLVACTLSSGLLVGMIPALVDCLQKAWQNRLNPPPGRLDWAIRLFYFTWLPAMPAVGWLLGLDVDRFPVAKYTLFGGLIGLIVGVAWLGMVRSVTSLLANMVFLGIAYSAVTTCTIRLMAGVLFEPLPSEPPLKYALASLNLGFIAIAIGAWLGPEAFQLAERWWGYRHGLLYLSLLCIGPAALAALSESAKFNTGGAQAGAWQEALLNPHLGLVAAIILLYFAIENCLEFWPEPYLKELGYEGNLRSGMWIFWIAFIGTRAAAAWWLATHPEQGFGLTLILVIASAMLMGNLVGGYDVGSGSLGFWLAGACYGPMLPCFLGLALKLNNVPLPNIALGGLLALSGLDTLIVRPLMQAYATNRPARSVMRVPTVLALLLAAPLLILAFVRN